MDAVKTGGLIAQRRKEKEWTQKDLAQRLHVSVQAVSKWERALSCPDIALLEPLAEALDLTVTELLSGQRGEEPGEEAVRDSLRFGLAQLGPKIRRWRWLFILAAALLLAVLAGLGYIWVRDNTELLPQRETVVRPVVVTNRESTMAQAAGKLQGHLYQVDFADGVTRCSFRWELWTHQGLEQSWDAGERERYEDGRRKLIAVAISTGGSRLDYGISLETPSGVAAHGLNGTLKPSYMGQGYAFSALEQRTEVDREEGIVLLALTLNPEGCFRTGDIANAKSGRVSGLPEDEQTAHLLLKMYCE